MGPLTKRRHSTHRAGNRQAGQPKLKLTTAVHKRLVGSRARRQAKATTAKSASK